MSLSPRPSPSSPFLNSVYCWAECVGPSRNQFVSFERKLHLDARPGQPVHLHLFADTRFRLWVNDCFVAYGPARFVTAHPEYDTYDICPFLKAGDNLLRVEVNYYGCSSFQTMPDGMPGFIAAGSMPKFDFSTPGAWRARLHAAWDAEAPLFSFAQNPAEICDTIRLAKELSGPASLAVVPLAAAATPWPRPVPRSVPYPDYQPVSPARLTVAGPLRESLRWGLRLKWRDYKIEAKTPGQNNAAIKTWIYSPRAQSVAVDCFWADLELNGAPVKISYETPLGNHGTATFDLTAGWNFLALRVAALTENWDYLLAFPPGSGVSLHARRDQSCTSAFAISPLGQPNIPLPKASLPEADFLPASWALQSGALTGLTPARQIAWESPDPDSSVRDLPFANLQEADSFVALAALWSFDFEDEYYGQPMIEVDAPAGSTLDVAYDDWKRADGCVNLYNSNPFTDAADRFILRGGRQSIDVLNPRGGIYLQLILRVPAGSPPATLRVIDLKIRRRITLTVRGGAFQSGDPLLDWAWDISTHTLQKSTDETYADCPWRERGSYIGDSLVNSHLHRLISADLSIARSTFEHFAHSQMPNGQLQCCAPSWLVKAHEDFTLLWIQAAHDYWAHTGDTAFVAAQLPVIRRIFESDAWKPDADGLWDTTGLRLFIDWGVLPSEREGSANTVINVLRIAALRAAATLARAVNQTATADDYLAQADRVSDALIARNWHPTEGRFLASSGATTPALHANVLALRYGVGLADSLIAYLEPHLHENFTHGVKTGNNGGFLELYFFHYLLPALATHNRVELAETLIAETYGFLHTLDYPTLPECFNRANRGEGSCCHSWSGAAAIYATDYVLGLRLATPGQPDTYLLDPVDSGREQVAGSIPHTRGLISVNWQRQPNGRITAQVTAPAGVTIKPASKVDIHFDRGAVSDPASALSR